MADFMCAVLNCTLALVLLLAGVWIVDKILKIIFGERK